MEERTNQEAKREWLYDAALDIKKYASTESELNELIRQLEELVPYKDTEALLQDARNTLELEKSYQAALKAESSVYEDSDDEGGGRKDYDEDDLQGLIQSFNALGQYKEAGDHAARAEKILDDMRVGRLKKKRTKIGTLILAILAITLLAWYEMRSTENEFAGIIARAEQGDVEVQNRLGDMYRYGQDVKVNYAEAVKWYRQAAEQGDVRAQYNLGEMYYNGQGVEKNIPLAVEWYRKVAERNDVEAQSKLGNNYYTEAQTKLGDACCNGWGVEKDYQAANRWYRRAALRGNAKAQTALGNIYYNGTGVQRNYRTAVWWYNMAASQDYAWAQYYLGNMYRNGLGVEKNLPRARELYQKAGEQGHLGAIRALEHINGL